MSGLRESTEAGSQADTALLAFPIARAAGALERIRGQLEIQIGEALAAEVAELLEPWLTAQDRFEGSLRALRAGVAELEALAADGRRTLRRQERHYLEGFTFARTDVRAYNLPPAVIETIVTGLRNFEAALRRG